MRKYRALPEIMDINNMGITLYLFSGVSTSQSYFIQGYEKFLFVIQWIIKLTLGMMFLFILPTKAVVRLHSRNMCQPRNQIFAWM